MPYCVDASEHCGARKVCVLKDKFVIAADIICTMYWSSSHTLIAYKYGSVVDEGNQIARIFWGQAYIIFANIDQQ